MTGSAPLEEASPVTSEQELAATPTGHVEDATRLVVIDFPSVALVLGSLDSYRMVLELRFEGLDDSGRPLQWRLIRQEILGSEPTARLLELTFEGMNHSPELTTVQVFETNGDRYLYMPGIGCISGGLGAANVTSDVISDPDSLIAGLNGAQLASSGVEKNGILSQHYRFDESMLPKLADESVTADGHLFLADDGGYITQATLIVEGQADFLFAGYPQDGTLWMDLSMHDVNQDLTVEPPTACFEFEGYPILPDAYQMTSLGDLVHYKSRYSIEDVVAYYDSQLAAAGWTANEEAVVLEDSAYLSYQRGDTTIIVSAEVDPVAGVVTIFISP